jgi:hypothetical protein
MNYNREVKGNQMTLLTNTFNYDLIQDTEQGTEERGIAVFTMCIAYAYETILDSLEINNRARRDGKHDTGLHPDLLYRGVVYKAKMDDESMVPLLKQAKEHILQYCLEQMTEGELILINEDGTISADWTPGEDEETNPEFQDSILDGVTYPLVSAMSPSRIVFFSENQEMFDSMFPSGNYDAITNGARHINLGLVNVSEHAGNYLYTLA